MELNVGNYVRTKYGIIAKLIEIRPYLEYGETIETKVCDFDKNIDGYNNGVDFDYAKEIIIKSRPKIIDLIEENDLLKIEYFSLRYNKRVTRLFEVDYMDDKFMCIKNSYCDFMLVNKEFNEDDKELNPIIKSVLTHEQFEAMKYVVGDKNAEN